LATWSETQRICEQVFGWKNLRGLQEPALKSLLAGRNVLTVMPTGSGKSLIYQIPACWGEGLVLVVSPLIALMHDQVRQARKKPVRFEELNSGLNRSQREEVLKRLKARDIDLLYLTPERFRKPEFWEALGDQKIRLLAVDEAHCISEWGQDFRPDYSRLGEIREKLGRPQTLALTATATPQVRADILKQLGLPEADTDRHIASVARPNLALNVHSVYGLDEKLRSLVGLRHAVPGSLIVYVSLISSLQKLSHELKRLGIDHGVYHGQLDDRHRHRQQAEFLDGEKNLMLATPAFGLGVDKADVRGVIHLEVPGSVESYYQEVGRAGRDGLPAECHLLFEDDDVQIQMDFLKWALPDPEFIRGVHRLLKDHTDRFRQEGADFLREKMNFYNRRDFRVETALNLLDRWDVIQWRDRKASNLELTGELPEEYLNKDAHLKREKNQRMKLYEMVQYAKIEGCRMRFVHEYFGETLVQDCGICDNCRRSRGEIV
jgi:ATP-dependent DNA helicase RecQ